MGAAFFDLDRTILACNSATLWVRSEVREGRLKRAAQQRGWPIKDWGIP